MEERFSDMALQTFTCFQFLFHSARFRHPCFILLVPDFFALAGRVSGWSALLSGEASWQA